MTSDCVTPSSGNTSPNNFSTTNKDSQSLSPPDAPTPASQEEPPTPSLFASWNLSFDENISAPGFQSLAIHMSKPKPHNIRYWMKESQQTVQKIVTNWQQELIDRASHVDYQLDSLAHTVLYLGGETGPLRLLTGKVLNRHGTSESVINIILYLIQLLLEEVLRIIRKVRKGEITSPSLQTRIVQMVSKFAQAAEEALKHLHSQDILNPAFSEMRNNLCYFIRQTMEEPVKQIIELTRPVNINEIRREQDNSWINELTEDFSTQQDSLKSFVEVEIGGKQAFWVKYKKNTEDTDKEEVTLVDMKLDEILQLILKLLVELVNSIKCSNMLCMEGELQEIIGRLVEHFQQLQNQLETESRQKKLCAETCSDELKKVLFMLETRFHQVEVLFQELAQHLKRIIGMGHMCSKQLIQVLEERNSAEDPAVAKKGWATGIVPDLTEDFFKQNKEGSIPECFPYLFRVVVSFFTGEDPKPTNKKIKEFWEDVRSETEELVKEINLKTIDPEYGVRFRIPVDLPGGKDDDICLLLPFM